MDRLALKISSYEQQDKGSPLSQPGSAAVVRVSKFDRSQESGSPPGKFQMEKRANSADPD